MCHKISFRPIQKQIHAMYVNLPPEQCTGDGVIQHLEDEENSYTHEAILQWSMMEEAKIRYSKIKAGGEGKQYSETLDHPIFCDVYPEVEEMGVEHDKIWCWSVINKDQSRLDRKLLPCLQNLSHIPDMEGCLPVQFVPPKGRHSQEPYIPDNQFALTPNLWAFDLCISAYAGVDFSGTCAWMSKTYHTYQGNRPGMEYHAESIDIAKPHKSVFRSPDSSHPTTAIMGGAFTRAITAFQDQHVVNLFYYSQLVDENFDFDPPDDEDYYLSLKAELFQQLHLYFHADEKYNTGDIDIFMQSSPLTRKLIHSIRFPFSQTGSTEHLSDDIISNIISFLGGPFGINTGDMERFVRNLTENVMIQWPDCGMVYSISPNATTVTMTKQKGYKRHYAIMHQNSSGRSNAILGDAYVWPRVTQCISLDPRADLVQALLAFDCSIVAGAYDGHSVKVLPRFILGFIHNANIISPMCYENDKTKLRAAKYNTRGFRPVLFDHNDLRQNKSTIEVDLMNEMDILLQNQKDSDVVPRFYNPEGRARTHHNPNFFSCHIFCNEFDPMTHAIELGTAQSDPEITIHKYYMFDEIEVEPDDALATFSAYYEWTPDCEALVRRVWPGHRAACSVCKRVYEYERILKPNSHIIKAHRLHHRHMRRILEGAAEDAEFGDISAPTFYAVSVYAQISNKHTFTNAHNTISPTF